MSVSLQHFDAAIIDLDGTLVDTLGDFDAALQRMLAEQGWPGVTRAQIEALVGKGSEHLIKSVLSLVHAAKFAMKNEDPVAATGPRAQDWIDAAYPAAWDSYQRHYLEINGQFSAVYPGVVQGLRALQAQGLKLACLTNKPTAFALPLLRAKGLEGFFPLVFGGDAFARKKPDPLPLQKTCEALGTAPARTLMVGDSSNDAQAARAAGCPVVLVRYGYNHGQPVEAVDCDARIDSLAELA